MKEFKLIGALCILISSSLIGIQKASCLKNRVKYLANIKASLNILESEISFSQDILEKAFMRISKAVDTKGLFETASENISELGIKSAWEYAVSECSKSLCLNKADYEALILFGEKLGMSDKKGQVKNIRNTISIIDGLIESAEKEYTQNAKLYRSGGVIIGLFFVIVLL